MVGEHRLFICRQVLFVDFTVSILKNVLITGYLSAPYLHEHNAIFIPRDS